MNKTLNINLGGLIFHIDEDAYHKLEKYLRTIKQQFAGTEGGEEIIKDIEMRIAELFRERNSESKEVITLRDVDEVIAIMGEPEDYLNGDEQEDYKTYDAEPNYTGNKRIFRDPDHRILGGVCAGLAAYFNIDPLLMRLLFVVLFFTGFGFLLYIVLWLVTPKANTTAEKLQMRGESVNVSNIERSIREELNQVGGSIKDVTGKARAYNYRKPTAQASNFLRDLVNFVFDAIKLIIKFIFNLIGFLFIAFGFLVLLAILISIISGGAFFMGTDLSFDDVYGFLQLVTINQSHLNMLLLGLSLLVLAPLILLVYFGVRIIFNLDRLGKPARSGLAGMALIGFILLLISGVRIAIDFEDEGDYTTYTSIHTTEDTLKLTALHDSIYQQYEEENFTKDWMLLEDGNHAFSQVYLQIEKSPDSIFSLEMTKTSQGPTRRAARTNAKKVDYSWIQSDTALHFQAYYQLEAGSPFRDQGVWLTLFVPEGRSVYFDNSLLDIIYDVQNIDDYYDLDMLNHTWQMTGEGLKCTDCPPPPVDHWKHDDGMKHSEMESDTTEAMDTSDTYVPDSMLQAKMEEGDDRLAMMYMIPSIYRVQLI